MDLIWEWKGKQRLHSPLSADTVALGGPWYGTYFINRLPLNLSAESTWSSWRTSSGSSGS